MEKLKDFIKVVEVGKSCKTVEHLDVFERLVHLYVRKYNDLLSAFAIIRVVKLNIVK